MNKSDLLEYARRDWTALAGMKAAYWAELKKAEGPGEAIRVGDRLRQQALRLRPAWPSDEERRRDIETHARVADSLSRAASILRR